MVPIGDTYAGITGARIWDGWHWKDLGGDCYAGYIPLIEHGEVVPVYA